MPNTIVVKTKLTFYKNTLAVVALFALVYIKSYFSLRAILLSRFTAFSLTRNARYYCGLT